MVHTVCSSYFIICFHILVDNWTVSSFLYKIIHVFISFMNIVVVYFGTVK